MEWVLVRYGELFLKSEPVKRHYIRILLNNISGALGACDIEAETEVHRGRVLVGGQNPEAIAAAISRVFGVIGVSRCVRTAPDRDEIEEAALHLALKRLQP
jgi:thiamine biosynthesis protein ThiI